MAEDWIRVNGIRLYGYHGVLANERRHGQPFEIDVSVRTCLEPAGISDDLESTVDYVHIYRTVERVFSSGTYQLIEAVAEGIAAAVLAEFPVDETIVKIRKPAVEMPGPISSAEIEIRRKKTSDA